MHSCSRPAGLWESLKTRPIVPPQKCRSLATTSSNILSLLESSLQPLRHQAKKLSRMDMMYALPSLTNCDSVVMESEQPISPVILIVDWSYPNCLITLCGLQLTVPALDSQMKGRRVGVIIANHIRSSVVTPLEEMSTVTLPRAAYILASAIPRGVKVYGRKEKYFSNNIVQEVLTLLLL